ncbi:hypothetical protein [Actinoplanes couchii]|uniref:Uncharacterized protein n=1 Tax=Actinoplanes couchii TaxID=403638 RepID=A0ABQ3XPI0_9ACTN|nr:hypothetical protein [Actinoplanes couchii]MDR6319074.1 hypothetical protein [Actinoplanes couchii]GID60417.1 hypothetical protein Aco03nite_088210 [Actinoplanes couchii]
MTGLVPFGIRLARLLELRGLPSLDPETTVDDTLLRRLGPELGLHTADLFLFAGLEVPEDLAPAQLEHRLRVKRLLWSAGRLDPAAFARVRGFVRELPARPVRRDRPFPDDGDDATPGVVLRRLLANRNIRMDSQVLMVLGGGPYVSTSTYWMATAGRIPLADRFVNPIARLIGISVGELAALLGIEAAEIPWGQPHPLLPELVDLAWALRRLDDEQVLATREFIEVCSAP